MTKPQWSKNRPRKPEVDPLYKKVVGLMERDKRSLYAKANVSGLSTSCLRSWQMGKVKRPQSVSLQMAAKMLGYELTLVKK